MTTVLEIIDDALRELNVINEVQTASAEQGAYGLRRLNQMLEGWKEEDIEFGWFKQTDTANTAPVPDWAELGVTYALAVNIASKYGASASIELAINTENEVNKILRKSISEKLDNTDMSHLPEGAGHWGNRYDITVDN